MYMYKIGNGNKRNENNVYLIDCLMVMVYLLFDMYSVYDYIEEESIWSIMGY